MAAELRPDAPRPTAQTSGPFYEPDEGGYASAILRVDAPNMIYAAMDGAVCERELAKRAIAFEKTDAERAAAPGVVTPLRLKGPLHGVMVRSGLPPPERAKAALEIFDCRLVLALDDFAVMVAKHDVVEMLTQVVDAALGDEHGVAPEARHRRARHPEVGEDLQNRLEGLIGCDVERPFDDVAVEHHVQVLVRGDPCEHPVRDRIAARLAGVAVGDAGGQFLEGHVRHRIEHRRGAGREPRG